MGAGLGNAINVRRPDMYVILTLLRLLSCKMYTFIYERLVRSLKMGHSMRVNGQTRNNLMVILPKCPEKQCLWVRTIFCCVSKNMESLGESDTLKWGLNRPNNYYYLFA